MLKRALFTFALVLAASSAAADFVQIQSRSEFDQVVVGRDLTRLGISVQVQPDGGITGSAFGRDVTGEWRWQDGFFCRELAWGERAFPYNCQQVARDGDTLLFVSDKGSGRQAKLQLN